MAEKTVGQATKESDKYHSFPNGAVIILNEDYSFPEAGKLVKFSMFVAKANIVWLQIWRPGGADETDYSLVYQQEVDTELGDMGLREYDVTDDVRVQPGDRIGLAVQEGALPVGCSGTADPINYVMKDYSADKLETKAQEFELCVSATYTTE